MLTKKEDKRQNDFFDTCSDCKVGFSCCFGTRPPITRERKDIIEGYLKKANIPISDPFVQAEYVFPREDADGYCIFQDKTTRKCIIHPVKPETCVAGPITFDINARNHKIEWYMKMEKICPLAGAIYKNKELLNKHLESAKKELLGLVQRLDSEALKAILKKDEPETFKIDEDNMEIGILNKLNT